MLATLNAKYFSKKLQALTISAAIILGISFSSALLAAQSVSAAKGELKQLEKSLAKLQQTLKKERAKRSKEERALQKSEQSIAQLGSDIKRIDNQLKGLNKNLQHYLANKAKLQRQLLNQQQALGELIKQRYKMGDQTPLKLLLKQKDPEQVSRMLTYFEKIRAHQSAQVIAFKALLTAQKDNNASIDETEQNLLKKRGSLAVSRDKLQASRALRKKNLAIIDKKIGANRSSIKKLAADKKRLNKVIQTIAGALSKRQAAQRQQLAKLKREKQLRQQKLAAAKAADKRPFRQLKGRLKWPAKGKVVRRFGSKENNLAYDGILIRTTQRSPVTAVHSGKVVFADWLRSYGMVMIVDHGSGYLTLYGHNDQLNKQVGDSVSSGEEIALSGSSGGNTRPGLYFAIRHNGKTTNPQSWLK